MNQHKKYRLSYTAGALLFNETLAVAQIYDELKVWNVVKDRAIEVNATHSRTASASRRYISEIITRLKSISDDEITFLLSDISPESKRQIIWFAICKTYNFISEFMEEVIMAKISRLDFKLENNDYDRFYLNKSPWHEELENLSESSKGKVKQVLLKMLKQMDIISENHDINEVKPTNEVISLFANNSEELRSWFPVF